MMTLRIFQKNLMIKNITVIAIIQSGIETCLLAISRGAKIIEKHFTLDKSDNTIRDHALSATPEEFRNLVTLGREINKKISKGL